MENDIFSDAQKTKPSGIETIESAKDSETAEKPETIETIDKLKIISKKMTEALKEENMDKFADLLNEHWKLSKKLDKGCTNTIINQIFIACDDLIQGKMICGAGGGGFLQVILQDNVSKEDLSKRIQSVFQDSGIKVYNATIYEGD